jgi:hypothetical protein
MTFEFASQGLAFGVLTRASAMRKSQAPIASAFTGREVARCIYTVQESSG